jgi:hypothetical protein
MRLPISFIPDRHSPKNARGYWLGALLGLGDNSDTFLLCALAKVRLLFYFCRTVETKKVFSRGAFNAGVGDAKSVYLDHPTFNTTSLS